ncbi:hypothetical protein OCU04_000242 [Sclerotinia nivalis]|uniref:Uncharacterized protein n=1 Tax=Sclerotinia nivalis TaxID=352851 RepID=A0A9X0DR38_9HELO|nr:hypothetical protein OCU04_000242 [Sclerotinia nivalis]
MLNSGPIIQDGGLQSQLDESFGTRRARPFLEMRAGLSEENGCYTKEKVAARQDMMEMLRNHEELLDVFNRWWLNDNSEVRLVPRGDHSDEV